MDSSAIIAIVLAGFTAVKTLVEVCLTLIEYHECKEDEDFCEEYLAHMNHHISIMIGVISMSIAVILQILAGIEFSDEWIAPYMLVTGVFVYLVEHFEHERTKRIRPIHPVKDLMSINFLELYRVWKRKRKEKQEAKEIK